GYQIDFPASVIEFFNGEIGQPYQGFPEKLQKIILKDKEPITERPGKLLEPVDFEKLKQELEEKIKEEVSELDVIAYELYTDVYLSYIIFCKDFANLFVFITPPYFYVLRLGEEFKLELEKGRELFIKLLKFT